MRRSFGRGTCRWSWSESRLRDRAQSSNELAFGDVMYGMYGAKSICSRC
jgi:hypothetical protein